VKSHVPYDTGVLHLLPVGAKL